MVRKRLSLQKTNDTKQIESAYADFLIHCKARNLSPATLSYYDQCYKLFLNVVPVGTSLEMINIKTIEEFILYLRESTNSSPVSINTRLKGVRAFLNYCFKMNYMDKVQINLLKTDKEIKETYNDTELKKLLQKPNMNQCTFAEYRNWVIINLLIGTGMRLNTLQNLRIKDINFEDGTILLSKTKTRKQQYIPLSKTLNKVLYEYVSFRNASSSEDNLFCNVFGEDLTSDGIKNAIKNYNKSRGVEKTSIHLFRHTFAKNYLLNGGDVFRLQKILGHSTLEMTRNYVNMYSNELQKDFDDMCPLEKYSNNREYIRLT